MERIEHDINLTDQTYFGYNLTLYFDGFDFRGLSLSLGVLVLVFEGLSFRNTNILVGCPWALNLKIHPRG